MTAIKLLFICCLLLLFNLPLYFSDLEGCPQHLVHRLRLVYMPANKLPHIN